MSWFDLSKYSDSFIKMISFLFSNHSFFLLWVTFYLEWIEKIAKRHSSIEKQLSSLHDFERMYKLHACEPQSVRQSSIAFQWMCSFANENHTIHMYTMCVKEKWWNAILTDRSGKKRTIQLLYDRDPFEWHCVNSPSHT